MFKKPIVWLLGALALVAAFSLFVAPKIAEYSANQTFQTNLTELQAKSKALSDKLAEPAGQALIAASKDKLTAFQTLQHEYVAAYPDDTKTSVVLDKLVVLLADSRTLLASQDEDLKAKVQDFSVAMSVVILRNPQLFAQRQEEVANVVEKTMEAYRPVASIERILDNVDSATNSLLMRAGKGPNPTPEDVASTQRTVLKMILDRAAAARNRAPQN